MAKRQRQEMTTFVYDWPKMKTYSFPTAPNETTTIVVRSRWVRISGGTRQRWDDENRNEFQLRVEVGSLSFHLKNSRTGKLGFSFTRSQPWKTGITWSLHFGIGYLIHSPKWAQEARSVHEAKTIYAPRAAA